MWYIKKEFEPPIVLVYTPKKQERKMSRTIIDVLDDLGLAVRTSRLKETRGIFIHNKLIICYEALEDYFKTPDARQMVSEFVTRLLG